MAASSDLERLIKEFKQHIRHDDMLELEIPGLFNGPKGPQYRMKMRKMCLHLQICFLNVIIKSYESDIDNWTYTPFEHVGEFEIKLYQNIKQWAKEGYVPEEFAECASELEFKARYEKGDRTTVNYIAQLIASKLRAAGVNIYFGNDHFFARRGARDRIKKLSTKWLSELAKVQKQFYDDLKAQSQDSDDESSGQAAWEDLMEAMSILHAGGDVSVESPDAATTLKRGAAERQKRLETYKREDEELAEANREQSYDERNGIELNFH
ncbi:hypothetical protein NHQ30_007973 [Ciborinia camelliae]|nr:hypothetical protein NHQ30_007973 [Ciborinia camelliae]